MYKRKCVNCYFYDTCGESMPCEHYYDMSVEFEDELLRKSLDEERSEYDKDFITYLFPFSDGNINLTSQYKKL